MEKMSEQEERRIMNALERVVTLTNSGSDPSDAVVKIASEERFTPPIVQRMVEAFNVSKTLAHMKNASGPSRADSFPLADAEKVLRHMYPDQVETPAQKQASVYKPEAYERPETTNFNKVATERLKLPDLQRPEPYPKDQLIEDHKSFGKESGLAKSAEEAKREHRILFYRMLDLAKQAAEHFKMASHTPFVDVERKVWREYGQVGRSAMDLVYEFSNRHEKRAEAMPDHQVMLDIRQEPYNIIDALIKNAHLFHEAAQNVVSSEATLAEFRKKAGRAPPEQVKEGCLFDGLLGDARPFDCSAQPAATVGARKEAADLGSTGDLKVKEVFHGKAEGEPDAKYSPKQIQEGVKVEKEHTPNPAVAKTIAKDHLEEIPNYYVPHLKEMEEEAKGEQEKKGFIGALGSTLGEVGSAGMGAMGLSSKDPEAARRGAIAEVMDPIHEAKLQAARTKALLNDFISNDPVLSSYEPRHVMTAYNHVAELAPSVSQQPSVMRGLLRRMMQSEGVLEPHEAEQISKIEKQLRGQSIEEAS